MLEPKILNQILRQNQTDGDRIPSSRREHIPRFKDSFTDFVTIATRVLNVSQKYEHYYNCGIWKI